jgi:beta-galactosidase
VRDKRYYRTVSKHYLPFYQQNVAVDVLFQDSDLSQHDIIVAPMLYMVKEGFAQKIESFVTNGGSFVCTYFSGIVDETDLAFENGYPGPLSRVLGIHVEEIDALYEGQYNSIMMGDGSGEFQCGHLADLLLTEGAEVLATYGSDFYQGMPAVTRHQFGKGAAYYIASEPEMAFLEKFYGQLIAGYNLDVVWNTSSGVEVTRRYKDGQAIIFILNHNSTDAAFEIGNKQYVDMLSDETIMGTIQLEPYGVRILREISEA